MPLHVVSTERQTRRPDAQAGVRLPLVLVLMLLLITVGLLFFWPSGSEPPPAVVAEESPPTVVPETNEIVAPEPQTTSPPPPPATLPPPTQRVRGTVSNLILMDPRKNEFPPEMIPWWQRHFQNLKESGPDGASAILEFLTRNEDVTFEGIPEYRKLGYPTLRTALIDALRSMSGQLGIDAQRQVLQMTSLPTEIVILAQNLEQAAPKKYRTEILDAARAVLAQAQAGELPGYDVGPLFQLLIRYAGTNAIPDLKNAGSRFKYYSAIGLARLPKGAGVPALIETARNTGGNDPAAVWPIVAEYAAKSDEARDVLLEAARAGKIPPGTWPELARSLGGYEHHISASPSTVPAGASYDNAVRHDLQGTDERFIEVQNLRALVSTEIDARLNLIDQLSALNPPEAAQVALANAKNTLSKRRRR